MNLMSGLTVGIATVSLVALDGAGHLRAGLRATQVTQCECRAGSRSPSSRDTRPGKPFLLSRNDRLVAVILGNQAMIDAYKAGIPGNGKPFPDGAKMAKVHWNPKQNTFFPMPRCRALGERGLHGEGQQAVRGQRRMGLRRVRLRQRVRYVHARHHGRHAPARQRRQVRLACHTTAKTRDYVFTEYGKR